MIFTSREFVEDTVVRLLSEGKKSPAELYQTLPLAGQKVTIQALYKALRYLLRESVLVKSGKEVALSKEWMSSISNAFQNSYSVPIIAEGESVSYDYKSLVNLDAYWKHVVRSLQERHGDYPTFLYSPYGIWFHIAERQESQTGLMREFEKQKRYGFMLIASGSLMDQPLKRAFQNDYLQVDLWDKSPFKLNEYFTIIGDYILTTKLSQKLTQAIINAYEQSDNEIVFEQRLSKVLKVTDRAKVKIERNSLKAKKLRKRLFKNFFLPPELKNKYELF